MPVAVLAAVAAPTPGNFKVSSPGDAAEVAARAGESGGRGSASTIYRDEETTPETTGDESGDNDTSSESDDPYADWKSAIEGGDGATAVIKWGSVSSTDKSKVKDEGGGFQRKVVRTMGKDSVQVLAEGGVDVASNLLPYTIFHQEGFADFLAGHILGLGHGDFFKTLLFLSEAGFGFLGARQVQILLCESALLLLFGFSRLAGRRCGYFIGSGSAFAVKNAIGGLQLGHGIFTVHGNGFSSLGHRCSRCSTGSANLLQTPFLPHRSGL